MQVELPSSLWPLVSRVAGCPWPPSSKDEAQGFVSTAARERLLPLLALSGPFNDVLSQTLEGFGALIHADRRRSQLLFRALHELTALMPSDRFLLLKGLDYAVRLYPERYLRPMADIDILVPETEIDEVSATLLAAGAEQYFPAGRKSMAPTHHERVFQFHDVTVEVHQSFIQRGRFTIDYQEVWGRKVAIELDGVTLYRLSDVDALVHHAVSMAIDEFAVSLIRYVDLWLMLYGCENFTSVVERAQQWSATHAVYGMLRQGSRCFPALAGSLPADWDRGLVSRLTARWLDHAVLPTPVRASARPGRFVQLWRKFWLMDRMILRVRFVLDEIRVWSALRGHRAFS